MPYIDPEKRRALLPYLAPFLKIAPLLSKGEINYIVSRIVASKYGQDWCDYKDRSEGVSVLQDACNEFRRRVLEPYEDKQIEMNGDIY